MKKQRSPAGPQYSEMAVFNQGKYAESQPDQAKAGCPAMNISAKHNPNPLSAGMKTSYSEPEQYK